MLLLVLVCLFFWVRIWVVDGWQAMGGGQVGGGGVADSKKRNGIVRFVLCVCTRHGMDRSESGSEPESVFVPLPLPLLPSKE